MKPEATLWLLHAPVLKRCSMLPVLWEQLLVQAAPGLYTLITQCTPPSSKALVADYGAA